MKKICSTIAVLVIIFSIASCREEHDELIISKASVSENAILSTHNATDTIRIKPLNTTNSPDGDNTDPDPTEGDPPPKNGQQWFN
ncbi:hypothetical protein [Elizabethkingia anophelis]|uniref:hypothetical protein n=1 Tax=Elizabethkingia anophelis TaxID=1117645 RepID=UPI002936F71C